jgi:hypothetical protein
VIGFLMIVEAAEEVRQPMTLCIEVKNSARIFAPYRCNRFVKCFNGLWWNDQVTSGPFAPCIYVGAALALPSWPGRQLSASGPSAYFLLVLVIYMIAAQRG